MLTVKHITKHYDDFSLDCSLNVQPGCITGLIGQNGAGKSTTFKAILNLIHLDGGEITLFGKNASALTAADKQRLGVALSNSGFSGTLTISDITHILRAMYPKYDKGKFLSQCRKFELPPDKRIMDFSTGMKAKLKILVALSHQAEFLILDEPTVGLDVMARDEILDLLRIYMEEAENRSILISSHIASDLEGLCDDFYMIHEGKIVLHEEIDVLLGSYALLKLTPEQFGLIDKQYILRYKKEPYGFRCLTDQTRFYMENYRNTVIENGNIDDLIVLMIGGTAL